MRNKIFGLNDRWNWNAMPGMSVSPFATPAIRRFTAMMGSFAAREENHVPNRASQPLDPYFLCAARLTSDLEGSGMRVVKLPDKLMVESTGLDGLAIYVFPDRRRATVAFGGWYDDFSDIDVLSSFVRRASTGQIRLRVDVFDGRPFRWTVEAYHQGNWLEENVMETAFCPRNYNKVISHYLQNSSQKS